MGDVAVALGADRPRRGVHVLAAVGDGDVPVHVLAVAVGRVHRDPDRRRVHDHVVRLVERDVDPAHRRVLVPPGADRQRPNDGAVRRDRHGVGVGVHRAHVGVADLEVHRPVGLTPDVVAGLDVGELGHHGDRLP